MNTSFVPVDCIASLEYYIHNMRAVTGLLLLGQNNSLDLNYTPFGIPDYTEQNNIGNQTLKPPDIEWYFLISRQVLQQKMLAVREECWLIQLHQYQ